MTWKHLGEDSFLPHQWKNVVFLSDDNNHVPLKWAEACSTCVIAAADVGSHLAKSSISAECIAKHIPF